MKQIAQLMLILACATSVFAERSISPFAKGHALNGAYVVYASGTEALVYNPALTLFGMFNDAYLGGTSWIAETAVIGAAYRVKPDPRFAFGLFATYFHGGELTRVDEADVPLIIDEQGFAALANPEPTYFFQADAGGGVATLVQLGSLLIPVGASGRIGVYPTLRENIPLHISLSIDASAAWLIHDSFKLYNKWHAFVIPERFTLLVRNMSFGLGGTVTFFSDFTMVAGIGFRTAYIPKRYLMRIEMSMESRFADTVEDLVRFASVYRFGMSHTLFPGEIIAPELLAGITYQEGVGPSFSAGMFLKLQQNLRYYEVGYTLKHFPFGGFVHQASVAIRFRGTRDYDFEGSKLLEIQIETAKQLISDGEYEEAFEIVSELQALFPANDEVLQLYDRVEESQESEGIFFY